MNKTDEKRYSLKSSSKKQLQKDYSLNHLHSLNAKLESQKEKTKKMLEKMKQQQAISNKIGHTVNTSILKVENDGVYFASRIEEEKRKNMMLTMLVAHYQSVIQKQKISNYQQMMKTKKILRSSSNNSSTFYDSYKAHTQQQPGNLEENTTKNQQYCAEKIKQLKKLQKEYDQFVVKTNASQYELGRKLDEVRTLRSERTVFNKIFDQFEKEIFDHQFGFKQLVIERSVLEASFEQKVNQFEKLNVKAEKQFQKLIKIQKARHESQRILDQTTIKRDMTLNNNEQPSIIDFRATQDFQRQKKSLTLFPVNRTTCIQSIQNIPLRLSLPESNGLENEPSSNKPKQLNSPEKKVNFKINTFQNHSHINTRPINNCQSIFLRQYEQQRQKNSAEAEYRKLQYQKKVKQIYEELKIRNSEDIPNLLENLDANMAELYKQSERLYELLYFKQRQADQSSKKPRKYLKNSLKQIQDLYYVDQDQQSEQFDKKILKRQCLRQKIHQFMDEEHKIKGQLANLYGKQLKKIKGRLSFSQHPSSQPKSSQYNQQQLLNNILEIQQLLNFLAPKSTTARQPYLMIDQTTVITDNNTKKQDSQQPVIHHHSKRDTYRSGYNEPISLDFMASLNHYSNIIPNQISNTKTDKTQKDIKKLKEQSAQYDINRLEQILKQNRTTQNNITIYTQEELVKISRYYLHQNKKILPSNSPQPQTVVSTSMKSNRDKNQLKTNRTRQRQMPKDKENQHILSYSRQITRDLQGRNCVDYSY